ncbi:uncharacterized protein K02A2.6-like [Zootoca vivipara]|uniref:uncharacterized protein K02A2.6-like n=2 Tax=Zootoca vivipara TaxID=8524 RepID=UPI00293BFF21|nr:uncharacterized protein K02A2.6-like [Zootoca vivipara]
MATDSSFSPFKPASGDWEGYAARFNFLLQAKEVTNDAMKRATFFSVCGEETFEIARALLAPRDVATVSYKTIMERLKEHFSPQPSVVACRNAFYAKRQAPGETITGFVTSLRQAARLCNFSELENMLRDRLVGGLRDEMLQRRLYAKKDLTFQIALEEALATEAAERSTQEARPAPPSQPRVYHEDLTDESESDREEVHRVQRRTQAAHTPQQPRREGGNCASCGENHERRTCRFRNAECRQCRKLGHIARVCRARLTRRQASDDRPRSPRSHGTMHQGNSTEITDYQVFQLPHPSTEKIYIEVQIEGAPCRMELDTGSTLSIISARTLRELCPNGGPKLRPAPFTLRDFQKRKVPTMGVGTFRVQYRGRKQQLDLLVVKGPYVSLLGLAWFGPLGLAVTGVNRTSLQVDVDAICKEFPGVFDGALGRYTGPPIALQLDPAVRPIRHKARRVPFALKPRIDEELDRLVEQGVLEPVPNAPWETPIVTPVKPNGSVRICADYKCTINKALTAHAYPVPVVSHVLATLAGSKIFGKLDLAQAYQQLPVDEATAEAQTIVTHRGAFRVKRLQFGVSVAPGIFQNLMDSLLKGIPGVTPFFDDVLIAGPTPEEFEDRLRSVLHRFQTAGLKVKREKCLLGVPQVDFLGFKVDAEGVHPTGDKVRAICEAPAPKSKSELQSFLGLLNFYHAFLPHKAAVAEPLHRLLDKRAPWVWGQRQRAAFQAVKDLLVSNSVLAHFDERLPVVLACDASPYGIGAVLGHQLPDGREVPVAYFSQTLAAAERNYSQIDKEGLAIVKGVKKFHDFLYGRPFTIVTDHKPLLGLFAPEKQTPQVLSPRVLRWSIFLAGYQYALIHRPGKAMGHADALSRLPLPETGPDPAPAQEVMTLELLPDRPIQAQEVAHHSTKDRVISRVLDWVWRGWPSSSPGPEFAGYTNRKHELSAHKGCLLWGSRVVVPQPLRKRVLTALHETHPGVVRMKALARSYVWWPGIDREIEAWVQHCQTCQESRPDPPRAPVQPWESARHPWSRLHVDFAGPFQGKTFFIVVDSYTKWLEVALVPSTSTAAAIRVLRKLFATHGLPDTLVSDNGTAFTSEEFQTFTAQNAIRHIRSAPFHPATNGQAERMVRTTKDSLRRMTQGDWEYRLAAFLLAQHSTPSTTTGRSPAELLMGRRLATRLDRLHPDRAQDEVVVGKGRNPRTFVAQDPVYAKNFGAGPAWVPATVTKVTGPVSYEVLTEGGQCWRRHCDQLRRRFPGGTREESGTEGSQGDSRAVRPVEREGWAGEAEAVGTEGRPEAGRTPEPELQPSGSVAPDQTAPAQPAASEHEPEPEPLTKEHPRPQRTRRRPADLGDYECNFPGRTGT